MRLSFTEDENSIFHFGFDKLWKEEAKQNQAECQMIDSN